MGGSEKELLLGITKKRKKSYKCDDEKFLLMRAPFV
jgi:hypothetical protein